MIYGIKAFFSTAIYFELEEAINKACQRLEGITTVSGIDFIRYGNMNLFYNFELTMEQYQDYINNKDTKWQSYTLNVSEASSDIKIEEATEDEFKTKVERFIDEQLYDKIILGKRDLTNKS